MELKNKVGIILLMVLILSSAQWVNAQALSLKQGETLFYPIQVGSNISAYFSGAKIPVFSYQNKEYALVSADVSKKTGNYVLRLTRGNQQISQNTIRVIAGNYQQYKKNVAYQFLTLPPAQQQKVISDKAPLLAALADSVKNLKPALFLSGFQDPLSSIAITSPFGFTRIYTNNVTIHRGTDLVAKIGTPVYAIADGKVIWGEPTKLYLEGPMVAIDHGLGIVSEYLHLSQVVVHTGDTVKAGDLIGYSGAEGADVNGPHLHFAMKVGNNAVNPLQFISAFQKLNSQ